jgi:hypothetical protein
MERMEDMDLQRGAGRCGRYELAADGTKIMSQKRGVVQYGPYGVVLA